MLLQGIVVTCLTLTGYLLGAHWETGVWIAQSRVGMTMAFLTLSLVETFHSFNMRSRRKSLLTLRTQNKWLLGSMVLSLVLTFGVLLIPFLRTAFGFAALTLPQYLAGLGLAFCILPVMEIAKALLRKLEL